MAIENMITQYVNVEDFPATKDEIILAAEENGAPFQLMDAVMRLPEGIYDSVSELQALLDALPR